jgi:hypothetical protein
VLRVGQRSILDSTKEGFTHELVEINPKEIKVNQIDVGTLQFYQKNYSKAIWNPNAGRQLGFTVTHYERIIGIMFLGSDVLTIKPRDDFLGLSKDKWIRGQELKDYFNLGVCVGVQPLAWYWNIGKLLALLSCTLGDFIVKRYPECDFKGIVTTSLWGKSVQYDRVFRLIGYTQGFGTEHIPERKYQEMLRWLRENNIEKPKWRTSIKMATIQQYITLSGEDLSIKHGHVRGIYFHAPIPPEDRQKVIDSWYLRWGLPRYKRLKDVSPPYEDGKGGLMKATQDIEVIK